VASTWPETFGAWKSVLDPLHVGQKKKNIGKKHKKKEREAKDRRETLLSTGTREGRGKKLVVNCGQEAEAKKRRLPHRGPLLRKQSGVEL